MILKYKDSVIYKSYVAIDDYLYSQRNKLVKFIQYFDVELLKMLQLDNKDLKMTRNVTVII